MTDEEKKAIDDLFALTHINGYIDLYTQKEAKIHTLDLSRWQNGVEVLLNLIEKQQKRIEKLTTNLFHYEDTLEHYENKVFNGDVIDLEKVKELDKIGILGKEYISKDKIREMIKHYNNELEHIKNGEEFENEKPMYYWGKVALEELLEEE